MEGRRTLKNKRSKTEVRKNKRRILEGQTRVDEEEERRGKESEEG